MNLREIRRKLKAYFGCVKNKIEFTRTKKGILIYIEYEDFRSEQVVESEVSHLVGESVLLSIKRECSPQLTDKICNFLAHDTDGRKTFFFMMGNYAP